MSRNHPAPGDEGKARHLLLPILGSVVAIGLILMLGFIANQLAEIEETIAYGPSSAAPAALPSDVLAKARAVYVPAYASIDRHDGSTTPLETTLSVRNTDPAHSLRIDRVRYFDTEGGSIREQTEAPALLGPLQTVSYLIEKGDQGGGSGANFIVEWSAQEEINPPVIEAIMIGPEGLSLTSRGVPIERR